MSFESPDITAPEAVAIAVVGLTAVAGILAIQRVRRRKAPTPEQIEEHRRTWLARNGKLGGGEIIELHDNSISYLYEVRGLTYTASQDTSHLKEHLPRDFWTTIGGVGVKYDSRNPANSIVLSETWTGLPKRDGKSSG